MTREGLVSKWIIDIDTKFTNQKSKGLKTMFVKISRGHFLVHGCSVQFMFWREKHSAKPPKNPSPPRMHLSSGC